MGTYFSHDEVFPIISRVITARYGETGEYVRHAEIAERLLRDPDVGRILDNAVSAGARQKRRTLASTMVAWFSQQITQGSNAWAAYFDRTRVDGRYAYRPITAVEFGIGRDVDAEAVEGEPRLVNHVRRERDRAIVEARKRSALASFGRLACDACGFDFRTEYPGLDIDFCEVHHNRPLSEAAAPVTTRLEDLSLLCSNCHRMIHRTRPLASVGEFRGLLRGARER
jgi:hypothetical protein